MPTGSSVGGATRVTSAPRVRSSSALERATRLCSTSPTIATRRPSRPPGLDSPRCFHIVNASSSAWVGCSWVPSPALTTLDLTQPEWASRCGAPLEPWRTTTASAPIASRVSAVSLRLSPLLRLEPLAEKLMTSALSRLAAASNEIRVRVESSKNRLTTVRPRSAGSFLIGRSASDRISSAVVRTSSASSRVRSAALSRWRFISPTPSIVTASTPSMSETLTLTRSTSEVGRFLPTKSARIGSSRWPRSTRTASRTALGRPTSLSASSAARMVRPLKSTSSTRTTTLPSIPPGGISVGSSVRAGLSRRSSRYMVTSSEPTGTSYPSTAAIRSAIRVARGTPRVGMPSRTRSLAPLLRSRISWEMRVRARAMSRSSRTVRPVGSDGAPAEQAMAGHTQLCVTSFSASRDGSLKDVDRADPTAARPSLPTPSACEHGEPATASAERHRRARRRPGDSPSPCVAAVSATTARRTLAGKARLATAVVKKHTRCPATGSRPTTSRGRRSAGVLAGDRSRRRATNDAPCRAGRRRRRPGPSLAHRLGLNGSVPLALRPLGCRMEASGFGASPGGVGRDIGHRTTSSRRLPPGSSAASTSVTSRPSAPGGLHGHGLVEIDLGRRTTLTPTGEHSDARRSAAADET